MKPGFAGNSMLLFGVSVVLLLLMTSLESALTGMSTGAERLVTFLLLVLPAGTGAVLGVLSPGPRGRAAVVGVDGGNVEWIVRAVPFDGCFVCGVAKLVKRFSNLRPTVLYTKDC